MAGKMQHGGGNNGRKNAHNKNGNDAAAGPEAGGSGHDPDKNKPEKPRKKFGRRSDNRQGQAREKIYAQLRESMVEKQIAGRGIVDPAVLRAMRAVPREKFIPRTFAGPGDRSADIYADRPAPIGQDQTISQPYIVAAMAQLAQLRSKDKVLEIGAGSGYGAAVLAALAGQVFTIERHEELAAHARRTLQDLGYDRVTVIHGDGSKGLPQEAPFDAIVVTAAAPAIPEILKQQLAVGGRLVIPVGAPGQPHQTLFQILLTSNSHYQIHEFGPVRFVPLIGAHGHKPPQEPEKKYTRPTPYRAIMRKAFAGPRQAAPRRPAPGRTGIDPVMALRQDAEPLPEPESPHFGSFFDRLGKAQIVLLGESTHGTGDFYRARAAITQRLIRNHNFNIVAFEADWPDMAVLDSHVRGHAGPDIGQPPFARFPEWMWRNQEFQSFVSWLHKYNQRCKRPEDKTGLYGLDLYGLKAATHAIIDFLEKKSPSLAEKARQRYGCFEPWQDDFTLYGQKLLSSGLEGCEKQAVSMLMDILSQREQLMNGHINSPGDSFLFLIRSAELVVNAEKFYRVMYRGGPASWNLRDRHMFNTLRAVLKSRGPGAKAVVWAHNSHIGDARATDMGTRLGEINLGQLCRENFGDQARLVGFGTDNGTVIAASYWGGPGEIMSLRHPLEGSYESLWQKSKMERALLDMTQPLNDTLQETLTDDMLQRAIGVIYRHQSERMSHYFKAAPARQFDYYVWLAQTGPVTMLPEIPETGEADTYPFGF